MMKKLFLLAAALTTMTSFVACNDDDYQPLSGCLVTTKGSDLFNFYYQSENHATFYVANKNEVAASGRYTPKDGQRATILFNELQEKQEGYTHNIRLIQINPHYTEDAVVATTQNQLDTLTAKADKIYYKHQGNATSYLSPEYLTLRIGHKNNDRSKHKYHLILDKVNPTSANPEYLDLKLVHQNDGDSYSEPKTELISFNIAPIGRELGGKKGINLIYSDMETEKEESVLIDMSNPNDKQPISMSL